MKHARLLWLGIWLWLSLPPAAGAAQARRKDGEKTPAGYREAVDSALEEISLGNFEEAREQFARAHALFPNARTLRGLGIAEFELRHYVVATHLIEQSLASNVKPLEPSMRRETEILLSQAQAYIGQLAIDVLPRTALLIVDGVRSNTEAGVPLRLDVGEHALEFRAEGFITERRTVTVRGGQSQDLVLQLTPIGIAAARAASTSAPSIANSKPIQRSERVPIYRRWWLWTVVGVAVAGAVVSAVVAVESKKHTEYRAVETENTPTGANLQPLWKF